MFSNNYVVKSLELHLFFGRIMKEHSFFLKAGFTPADASFAKKADFFKTEFEKLLSRAVFLSDGIVSREVLCSGEIVTEFTALAEKQSENFTGIPINRSITEKELRLVENCGRHNDLSSKCIQIRRLNQTALRLLDGLIELKECTLERVLCCEMFTMNYPLLIEHIIREAKLYRQYVKMLEINGDISCESMKEIECFWNQIMMEHALFIRALLDPTEVQLFCKADGFAKDFAELLKCCNEAQSQTLTAESLSKTTELREFKIAGVQGIERCKIRSLILPLLADHVLREANHYIRLLNN